MQTKCNISTSQERLKIEVKLLLSANRKSCVASIETTVYDVEWLWIAVSCIARYLCGSRACCCCCLKDATFLSEEIAGLRSKLEDCAKREKTDNDAMYHLQVAQLTLNERYSKLRRKNAELQKRLQQTMMKLVLVFVVKLYVITHTHTHTHTHLYGRDLPIHDLSHNLRTHDGFPSPISPLFIDL